MTDRFFAARLSTGANGVVGRPAVVDLETGKAVSYHRTDAKAEQVAAKLNAQVAR